MAKSSMSWMNRRQARKLFGKKALKKAASALSVAELNQRNVAMDNWDRVRQGAEQCLAAIIQGADEALADRELAEIDRQFIKNARQEVTIYGEQLVNVLEIFRKQGQGAQAEFAMESFGRVLQSAYVIGSRGAISERATRRAKWLETAILRNKREIKNQAREAIIADAVNADDDSKLSVKTHRLNQKLAEAGHKTIEDETFRKRRKKR
jgi:hypothetical protein